MPKTKVLEGKIAQVLGIGKGNNFQINLDTRKPGEEPRENPQHVQLYFKRIWCEEEKKRLRSIALDNWNGRVLVSYEEVPVTEIARGIRALGFPILEIRKRYNAAPKFYREIVNIESAEEVGKREAGSGI